MNTRKKFIPVSIKALLQPHPATRIGLRMALGCAIVLSLLIGVASQAQVNTGTLSGQVTDSSGAVVRGATLSIQSPETGYTRVVNTEGNGDYVFPDLPIGNYTLTVTASGFTTAKEDETISVGSRTRADFRLSVGSTGQTVEVTAEANNLSKDDASISTIVPESTIAETPLFLRNWDDLLRTV